MKNTCKKGGFLPGGPPGEGATRPFVSSRAANDADKLTIANEDAIIRPTFGQVAEWLKAPVC